MKTIEKNDHEITVIGGGPAGMMAAITAARNGADVALLEKNPKVGRKLRITGKGRCNITNDSDIETHLQNIKSNAKFLLNAYYRFGPADLIDFIQSCHVPLKTERGQRVFPESDRATDIAAALNRELIKQVKLYTSCSVRNIRKDNGVFHISLAEGGNFTSSKLIIATGGISYPATGSTGDGYKFANNLGHKIKPLSPSLVPLEIKEKWFREISNLSLKNVTLSLYDKQNRLIFEEFGELLITNYGISGPIALSASAHIEEVDGQTLRLDLKPAMDEQTLDKRLLRAFDENMRKHLGKTMKQVLPNALVATIAELADIPLQKPVHQISRAERKRIGFAMKNMKMTLSRFRPIEEAIVTKGGVLTSEIEPQTMQSKICKGLYFAGEIIDVDAYTGGFNLQIAFTTGYVAGYASSINR
jgi:hypothetical protein